MPLWSSHRDIFNLNSFLPSACCEQGSISDSTYWGRQPLLLSSRTIDALLPWLHCLLTISLSWLCSDQKGFEVETPQELIHPCDHWEWPVGHIPCAISALQVDTDQIPLLPKQCCLYLRRNLYKSKDCNMAPYSCDSIIHVLSQLSPMWRKKLLENMLLGVNFILLASDKMKYLYQKP